MGLSETIWSKPADFLRNTAPEHPVIFFSASVLRATAQRFISGFPGMVTYAVKSNPSEEVLMNLVAAGIRGFDVASIWEIELLRRLAPGADLHYNNPVRSIQEIRAAVAHDIRSYSVDSHSELTKLLSLVPAEGREISVRFKLPVQGGIYNFGTKFGAEPEVAAELLRRVAEAGFIPSLTFHPGTQCTDPTAWVAYIHEAAKIARAANVRIARLNTGGGFPAHRVSSESPMLEAIFACIADSAAEAFGVDLPELVCEPGRGLVAESYAVAARIKAIRDQKTLFLNDGVYGAFAELPLLGIIDRITAISEEGGVRKGAAVPRVVFGPTCDSVDRLPGELALPGDIEEGDFLLFAGMGAYSTATATRFNGFGDHRIVTVHDIQ